MATDANKSGGSAKVMLGPRSKGMVIAGKTLIFMTTISFLLVGLLINVLQVIIFLALQLSKNPKWRSSLKKLNGQLLYILFSPPICLLYYWSRLALDIQVDDLKLIEESKQPMLAIIIPNHSYELDYMICFALADQLGNLGAYKSMSKNELKYLPIVGWALWMSDIIFVKRNWLEDRRVMGRKLNQLFDYEQSILGVFSEGTRYTDEKYHESVKIALSRGIKPFKHHLLPRKRGFNYTVRHYLMEIINNKRLDEKLFRLFNMQIIMPDRPRFKNFLNGDQLRAHIYCEEVQVNQEVRDEVMRSKDEDDCPKLTELLHSIYRRKDEIVDDFYANGNKLKVNSTRGGPFPLKQNTFPLAVWLSGLCGTYLMFGYLALTHFSQSTTFWSLVVAFVGACFWMLRKIETESKTKRSVGAKSSPQQVSSDSSLRQPSLERHRREKKTVSFDRINESDDETISGTMQVQSKLNNNNNNNLPAY